MDDAGRTSLGLDENLAGALAYVLGWLSGLALYFTERESSFVRFHAIQSSIVFGALCALWFVGLSIPIFGWMLSFLVIPPVSAVVWLLMMFKAYKGERYELPFAGRIARESSAPGKAS